MPQLPERLGLDLPNSLTCHRELLADFLKRVVAVRAEAEAHAQTRSSRGVSEASIRVVVSRRFDWIAASIGRIAFVSSIKSPRWESPSSPIGVSSESGSLAIFRVLRTFSSGMPSFLAISSGVGSRPISLSICRRVRTILLMVSIMCTGTRMVRD